MKFVYTVWLREPSLTSDDQDYEWPACFVIDGRTRESAQAWGDFLATRYVRTRAYVLLSSSLEPRETTKLPGVDALPCVVEAEEVSDEDIGW